MDPEVLLRAYLLHRMAEASVSDKREDATKHPGVRLSDVVATVIVVTGFLFGVCLVA